MSLLKQDLEHLAQERLSGYQELPSAEQLIALRDGHLDGQQADHLRLQMAADPELAEVYLGLCRAAEDAESAQVSDEQIEQSLHELMDRVGADKPGKDLPLARRNRRYAWAGWAAVAATLLLVFGLRLQQPEGPYFPVEVPAETSRSSDTMDVELSADHDGLELFLSAELLRSLALESATAIDIRFETLKGKAVAEELGVSTTAQPITLIIRRRELADGRTYVLRIKESDQGAWPTKNWSFRIGLTPSPSSSP